MGRWEAFDPNRDAEALARFDELTAEPAVVRPARRRVRPNAASAAAARLEAVTAARDSDAFSTILAERLEVVDHPTGVTYDRQGFLATWRAGVQGAQGLAYRQEPLATLGDSLVLYRSSTSASGFVGRKFDVGPYTIEQIVLAEADAEGRLGRQEIFATDRLGVAVARLYERYAERLPDGRARARADATARAIAALLGPFDPDRYATAFAPDIDVVDHRTLGTPAARGADAMLQGLRSWLDLADGATISTDEILSLHPDALLLRRTFSGTDRASGGAFELSVISLIILGTDGLAVRSEWFDPDREAEALARFDELTAEPAPTSRIENAATRSMDRFDDAWNARDWIRIEELSPAGWRHSDRRKMIQLELDREQYLAQLRMTFEMASSRIDREIVATRGDRLALCRIRLEVSDRDIGPSEIHSLTVLEVGEHGERVAQIRFDADDLDAAYAELDARYAAGEAAAHPAIGRTLGRMLRALSTRDWERLASVFSPGFVLEDHRLLGWGTLRSREEWVARARSLVDLRPDATLRVDHVTLQDQAGLVVAPWIGSETDGAFEIPMVGVLMAELDGRIDQWHVYDPDQLDTARARFAELRPDPLRIPANTATRAMDRRLRCVETQDWDALRALCAPTMVFDDRRRLLRTTGDCDMFVASAKVAAESGARLSRTLLATSGDRLALDHSHFTDDGGTFEVDTLNVNEVDAEGRFVASITFDPDARRAASAELRDRFAQTEEGRQIPAVAFEWMRAYSDRDLERVRGVIPDDFVIDDHRRTGLGRLECADYLASVVALFDQAPDLLLEDLYYLSAEKYGSLAISRMSGTLAEGGEFESVVARIASFQGSRLVAAELFELEHLDLARARFEELRPDPLRIPPNAASRARDRSFEAWVASDWGALRALATDDFRFEDRGKRALVVGGVERWIESFLFFRSERARPSRELIGTIGDRVAIECVTWTRAPAEGAFDVDRLTVTEVDADGRFRARILFDPDDRRAAFEEAQARFLAGEAAAIGGQAPVVAFDRAFARDSEMLRTCIADDAVICDRGSLSLLGTLDRDQYVASVTAVADLAPDLEVESFRILTWNGRGRVDLARRFGTRDGGPFENFFARVFLTAGDRIQRFEMFDADAGDQALARFAELCADRE